MKQKLLLDISQEIHGDTFLLTAGRSKTTIPTVQPRLFTKHRVNIFVTVLWQPPIHRVAVASTLWIYAAYKSIIC